MNLERLQVDEHVFSGIMRSRLLSAGMHMSDFRWLKEMGLPCERLQTHKILNKALIESMKRYDDQVSIEFGLKHSPLAPWLLSISREKYLSYLTNESQPYRMPAVCSSLQKVWRLCPECIEEDCSEHGFSYWHTSHQHIGVQVCAKHRCLLHTHDELFKADFRLPQQWNDTAMPIQIEYEWQYLWQPFMLQLSAALEEDVTLPERLRSEVFEYFGVSGNLLYRERGTFDEALKVMEAELGESFFKHMIACFELECRQKTNPIWVVLYDYDVMQSRARHPIYMLMVLFWLRDKLPSLGWIDYEWRIRLS